MDDTIKINLQMAGSTYPLTILRKEEEMIREAAKQVDMRLNAYRERYSNISIEKVLTMVAYQFALESLKMKEKNDTLPYASKIDELTAVLEDYIKKG